RVPTVASRDGSRPWGPSPWILDAPSVPVLEIRASRERLFTIRRRTAGNAPPDTQHRDGTVTRSIYSGREGKRNNQESKNSARPGFWGQSRLTPENKAQTDVGLVDQARWVTRERRKNGGAWAAIGGG